MTTIVHYSFHTLPRGNLLTRTELFFDCVLIAAPEHTRVSIGRVDVIKKRVT